MNLFCSFCSVTFCRFFCLSNGLRLCKFGCYRKISFRHAASVVRESVKIGQEPSAGYPFSDLSWGIDRMLHSWQCSIAPWCFIVFFFFSVAKQIYFSQTWS